MSGWQLQEAKTRLSELIEVAHRDGPQMITRHGRERAVVLSVEDYRAMVGGQADLKGWLLRGPKVEDWVIERERDTGREVEL